MSNEPRASSLRTMVVMGAMMTGASTVDAITANMLPITAKHFTDNIGLISFMVALNRICGFLVQPYAAWKSDRHWSKRGHRRPFLLLGWPATLVSVAVLGALPYVVPTEYHRTTTIVALLFVANLAMQAFLDFCYGSADPMYGDLFTKGDLGRANGVRVIVNNIALIAMSWVFVPLADHHEFLPYLGSILFLIVSWLVAGFLVKEPIPTAQPPPGDRYNPFKPLLELRDPRTRYVAIAGSAVLVTLGLTEMLHALFVTETLGFSKKVLGQTVTAGIVVSLLCPYPIGLLADRVGARMVMIIGFVAVALVEMAFVFWVNDLTSLYIGLILFKISWIVVHVPMVALMFQDTPPERRGTIFAAVQTTRAGAASLATIVAGSLAGLVGSYRMCYLVAGLICLVGIWAASRLNGPNRKVGSAVPADVTPL